MVTLVATVHASDIVRMPMNDIVSTDMDYVFEVKTNKFDKVILDCQSFITGMNFSNAGVLDSDIYLDMFQCEEMVNFLKDSKSDNLPVCIGLDRDNQELLITREKDCD